MSHVSDPNHPGVNRILRACGLLEDYPDTPAMQKYRDRGKAGHLAIQWHQEGTLDERSLHADLRPRFDAYLEFCDSHGFTAWSVEVDLIHPKYGYRGILDAVGPVKGEMAIVDWKFSDSPDLHGATLALAAYDLLWAACEAGTPATRRYVVALGKDGKPKVHDVTDEYAKQVFLSCVLIYNYRKEIGR